MSAAEAAALSALIRSQRSVRDAFDIPAPWWLICGVSIGYASTQVVNGFTLGRGAATALRVEPTQHVGSVPK
ncbi:MAG: hypothetical protein WCI59_15395 [Betaproteobacteria bacterium]